MRLCCATEVQIYLLCPKYFSPNLTTPNSHRNSLPLPCISSLLHLYKEVKLPQISNNVRLPSIFFVCFSMIIHSPIPIAFVLKQGSIATNVKCFPLEDCVLNSYTSKQVFKYNAC